MPYLTHGMRGGKKIKMYKSAHVHDRKRTPSKNDVRHKNIRRDDGLNPAFADLANYDNQPAMIEASDVE